MVKFCVGHPRCKVCGAITRQGILQNCPAVRGKRAQVARQRGLGTSVSRLLSAIGYTKARNRRLRLWLGLLRECGCDGREAALNCLGDRVGRWLGRPLVWWRDWRRRRRKRRLLGAILSD